MYELLLYLFRHLLFYQQLLSIEATDSREGEQIDRYPLKEDDVVVADRGYNQRSRIIELSKRGILSVIRLNPWSMPLRQRVDGEPEADAQKLDLYDYLKQTTEDKVCLPVWLGDSGNAVEGCVHAHHAAVCCAHRSCSACTAPAATRDYGTARSLAHVPQRAP